MFMKQCVDIELPTPVTVKWWNPISSKKLLKVQRIFYPFQVATGIAYNLDPNF